ALTYCARGVPKERHLGNRRTAEAQRTRRKALLKKDRLSLRPLRLCGEAVFETTWIQSLRWSARRRTAARSLETAELATMRSQPAARPASMRSTSVWPV